MRGQSIKNQVYESIRKDILDGVYDVNTVINEKKLVEKYGVSKTSVREALVQLCSEGSLKNIPRFGYQLSVITPDEIREVIEFRRVLEVSALELSFSLMTEKELLELKLLNSQVSEIAGSCDTKIHWDCNQKFHRTLCSYCRNRYIQKSLEDALNVCTRIANQYFSRLWKEGKPSDGSNHVNIVEALEKRDLEKARRILTEDVRAFRNCIL